MKLGFRKGRWSSGRGSPTASDCAVVRAQWDVSDQNRCLASRAWGTGGQVDCLEEKGFFGRSYERKNSGTDPVRF